MARKSELEQLREMVLKRHEAATKKISRLRRQHGIEINSTKYDPRVARPADIRKMRTRDAVRHLERLETFTSRRNGFVALREHTPAPKSKWNEYEAQQKINRERGTVYHESVANIVLPNGETIAEYKERNELKGSRRMGFIRGNRAFLSGERNSTNIKGAKALDIFIRDLKKKNTKGYSAKVAKESKKAMIDTLIGGGVQLGLLEKASSLTLFQADLLWNHTGFAQEAGEHYHFNTNDKEHHPTTSNADRESRLEALLNWAGDQQRPQPETAVENAVQATATQAQARQPRGRRR